jgi:hypothetical protein
MQINDGSEWHFLPCYDKPQSLDDGVVVRVLDDRPLCGFQAAWKASSERTATLFRLNDDEPGQPFWVELSHIPTMLKNEMIVFLMILTPVTQQ